jgi:hypothetical protein
MPASPIPQTWYASLITLPHLANTGSRYYKAPSAAAAVVKNGDHIEIEPGQYFDCAVWNMDNLVIEGTGPGVVITDKTCMEKGLFVIEGNNTTVRNLTLTRSRVPDMNGAGIRLGLKIAAVDRTAQGLADLARAAQERQQGANLMTIEARPRPRRVDR